MEKENILKPEIKSKRITAAEIGLYLIIFALLFATSINANEREFVSEKKIMNSFTLSEDGKVAPLVISSNDHKGVFRVLDHFQKDIQNVTGVKPDIIVDNIPNMDMIVIVGTLGQSKIINDLVSEKKIIVDDLKDKWEKFIIQTIDDPYPNVKKALVIVGSNKRGTIYGMFEISEQIGVSPWYWWADVPIKKKNSVYIKHGKYTKGEPKVKYRGIFINDEAPALSNWSIDKFGTQQFNHKLYVHVFELILRLKGNFLWPAMWGRAFYDDDPLNPQLADEYGIVISTSHHEPMMRAHVEWERYGEGPWNYEKNAEKLREFWREGIERMGDNESVVTLAMRGDGDEAMSETANISLLQKIVNDQRKILQEVTGTEITEIPQVWALYKEVQEYYDKGMRVPEDVTLLLCDDNWGNIRKLPNLNDPPRSGGYGIYYHYDYVGGPRNYKWINTTQIEKVWQQMSMAYAYGANEIWIVNVGDIKPMEFPISFFLDYAWDPEDLSAKDLPSYYVNWAEKQFDSEIASDIAHILSMYTKFNSRRKPEMLSEKTYSLFNYREAETVVNEYKELYVKAKKLYEELPKEYKDAYYQLVLHPVEASANLNELYYSVALNHLYAEQGRNLTNTLAEKVEELYIKDSLITKYYNEELADGKWNHMMDQTHIGYTYWQQPEFNSMPKVIKINTKDSPEMGVTVEGSSVVLGENVNEISLPTFFSHTNDDHYIEIFNKGEGFFNCVLNSDEDWLIFGENEIKIENGKRLSISIDWNKINYGEHNSKVYINGAGKEVVISLKAVKIDKTIFELKNTFIEGNGFISIDATNFSNRIENDSIRWEIIPNLGKTGSAITNSPVTKVVNLNLDSPRLEYNLYLFEEGDIELNIYLSPILNYGYTEGIKFGVSFNDDEPAIININEDDTQDWKYPQYWNEMVGNNIRLVKKKFTIPNHGLNKLKIWAISPGVVYQKIVIDTGGLLPSYLGPSESYNNIKKD